MVVVKALDACRGGRGGSLGGDVGACVPAPRAAAGEADDSQPGRAWQAEAASLAGHMLLHPLCTRRRHPPSHPIHLRHAQGKPLPVLC